MIIEECFGSVVKCLGAGGGDAQAQGFEDAAYGGDEVDALADEGVADFEGDEVFLGLFGAVLNGAEEVAVGAEEFGEHAGIELIAFAVVLIDGAEFAGIGDGDVHACLGEVAADPGAVCADFDGDGGVGMIFAEFLECGAVVGDGEFLENGTIRVCGADMVFLIAEVDADEASTG